MRFLNDKKGFTLLEVIVSLSIISLLLAVFLTNYSGGSRKTNISLAAQKLVSDIRYAQNNGLGLASYNSQMPLGGWGIHFDRTADDKSYTIFADLNNDKILNSPAENNTVFGARVVALPYGVAIASIDTGNALDITFVPPDPITRLWNGASTSTASTIRLQDINGNTRDIKVNFFGLVEVL